MDIRTNVSRILTELPSNVCLVAVVKSATLRSIEEVLRCGVSNLAFNNYTQLAAVNKLILKDFRRHFIGHIQTNKAKLVLMEKPYLIQSVDSFRLAKKLNSFCDELKMQQDILIQVKTDEGKENGFHIDEVREVIFRIESELKNLRVRGLMTVPPQTDEENLSKIFVEMKNLYNECELVIGRKLDFLSMGMSEDYRLAVEKGANMVRIGKKLFV
jgi:pyridoxal phosphate enzyme (YggS family)